MNEKQSAGIGKGTPGPGRKKGVPNKNTALIRDLIIQALDNVGGVAYLEEAARSSPTAFLGLIGKVMPVQIEGGDPNKPVGFQMIRRTIVDPKA
jgi:hypothetical protein